MFLLIRPAWPKTSRHPGPRPRRARQTDRPSLAKVRGRRADGKIIGAAQLREHPDGSRELGGLVVATPFRGRGIASQLIDRRLTDASGRVYVITGRVHADFYRRWGFRPIKPNKAPFFIAMNYWIGYLGGGLQAIVARRAVNHLGLFERWSLVPGRPASVTCLA